MRVQDISPGPLSSSPFNLTALGDLLYFTARTTEAGAELWKSDGTAAGTVMVADMCPGPCNGNPQNLTVYNGNLYFSADNGINVNGRELWVSDGTDTGTFMLKDINPGPLPSAPSGLYAFDDTLYFSATTAAAGTELWQTDGTPQGTVMLADLAPGTPSSLAFANRPIIGIKKAIVFVATDGIMGLEIWKSDKHGIFPVQDIAPGPGSANPSWFVLTKKRLFFTADDNTNGRELYVMRTNVAHLPPPAMHNHQHKFKELQKHAPGPGKHSSQALQHLIDNALLDLLENGVLNLEIVPGEEEQ
jgi:ELWxxDGT repeat protein